VRAWGRSKVVQSGLIFALLMSWTNGRLEPLHMLVMELVRLPEVERDPVKARVAMIEALDVLEARLTQEPYVAGDRFTVGDVPVGAAVYRWLVFDLKRPEMPDIAAWQARLAGRKGFTYTSLHGKFISRADDGVRQGSMPLPTPGRCVGTGARLRQLMIVIAGERAHGDPVSV